MNIANIQKFVDENPNADLAALAKHLNCSIDEAAAALKFVKPPDHALRILRAARVPLTLLECQRLCSELSVFVVSELISEMLCSDKLCIVQNPKYVEGTAR